MSEIKAVSGQSLFDICIQGGYKIEDIYQLMIDNNISDLNQLSFVGKTIIFNDSLVNDFGFQKSGIVLLSGEFVDQYNIPDGGSYLLRQDGTLLLRQDGTNFIRQ